MNEEHERLKNLLREVLNSDMAQRTEDEGEVNELLQEIRRELNKLDNI